jgi:hypothetical protein
MNQNIWGPHLWFSLHTISFAYPLKPTTTDIENCKNFFETLQNVIPCSVCKKNYIRHLKEYPINGHLHTRKELVYWVIDLHNMVNAETGKKILSYENVIKKYELVYKKKINLNSEEDDDEDTEHDAKYEEKIFYKNNNINTNINTNDTYNKYKNMINIIFIIFIILLVINLLYLFFYSKN